MAWAHVQTNGNSLTSTGTTITHTYSGAVTPGSMLVCFIAGSTTITIVSVEDDVNGAWSLAKFVDGGANPGIGAIYYFPNTAAGTPVVTVTYSATTAGRRLICSEYSGMDLTTPFDVAAGQGQTNPGTGTDAVTSGVTAAIAQANSLAYGATNCVSTTAAASGTGFTERYNVRFAGTAKSAIIEDMDVSAAVAATFTTDSSTADPVSLVAIFKAAAAGGGGFGQPLGGRRNNPVAMMG